jgi:membrane protease YdiL (CAAX protease family)
LKKELRDISRFVIGNKSEIAVIGSAVLFMVLARYHQIGSAWTSSLLYYLVMPLVVLGALRRNPLQFGMGPGNPKVWGWQVLIACLVLAPILYGASRLPAFQSYYRMDGFNPAVYALETFVYLLGWEYIFRGFLLFGLKDRLKEGAILVQMVPFVLLHLGKPELETISTVFTGIYFGYLAYRGNSYWPAFIIHLFINIGFVVLVNAGW